MWEGDDYCDDVLTGKTLMPTGRYEQVPTVSGTGHDPGLDQPPCQSTLTAEIWADRVMLYSTEWRQGVVGIGDVANHKKIIAGIAPPGRLIAEIPGKRGR